jgi:hypothetical protein
MKCKFLRAGRFAHEELRLGQFEVEEGQVVNGIAEADAKRWAKAGALEIIGPDDADEDDVEADENDDSDGADDGDGNGGEGNGTPW